MLYADSKGADVCIMHIHSLNLAVMCGLISQAYTFIDVTMRAHVLQYYST
jgi:hypothetical protein